jgi:hypothetical protein
VTNVPEAGITWTRVLDVQVWRTVPLADADVIASPAVSVYVDVNVMAIDVSVFL